MMSNRKALYDWFLVISAEKVLSYRCFGDEWWALCVGDDFKGLAIWQFPPYELSIPFTSSLSYSSPHPLSYSSAEGTDATSSVKG